MKVPKHDMEMQAGLLFFAGDVSDKSKHVVLYLPSLKRDSPRNQRISKVAEIGTRLPILKTAYPFENSMRHIYNIQYFIIYSRIQTRIIGHHISSYVIIFHDKRTIEQCLTHLLVDYFEGQKWPNIPLMCWGLLWSLLNQPDYFETWNKWKISLEKSP